MNLQAKKEKLIEDLSIIEDPQERFVFVMDLGKKEQPLDPQYKIDTFLIEGCVSALWVYPTFKDGKCYFQTDADSLITRGIAALVSDFYSDNPPADIVAEDASFLADVGITQHLSTNRRNGLSNLCKRIRDYAQHCLQNTNNTTEEASGKRVDCIDYDPSQIEPYWQAYWEKNETFAAVDFDVKPKYYILDMFPYPSGAGLHVGHAEGYTASDILARYHWAKGFNVLHPMGWDAFGLPAEQYAIQTGTNPAKTTRVNIDHFREQIKSIGFAIDWNREVNTTDPQYYRWTQWIFLKLFQKGLAYVDKKPVWWCPALDTVLANEEVIDGKSERGNHPVERRALRQWVLKITAYADPLLEGLKALDWPDSTRRQQHAWIGRSEGATVVFEIEKFPDTALSVFTTRPDTLFGATYLALAPEHPLVKKIMTDEQKDAIEAYRLQASRKSDLERTDLAKDKTGVFTGAYAINPVNQASIPIWIADYVLMSYGTGSIMAVPAHDERDFEFAQAFDLPMTPVIENQQDSPENNLPYTGHGKLIHSAAFTGFESAIAKTKITQWLKKNQKGENAVQYRLRDWLFSRQRYWGEPFPIVWVDAFAYESIKKIKDSLLTPLLPAEPVTYLEGEKVFFALPLPASQLPLLLPEMDNYASQGNGESPLAGAKQWVDVYIHLETGQTRSASEEKPEGSLWVSGRRETNSMPQWAGSCWYYLRYCDPGNKEALIDPEKESYWKAPDCYIGGAEHAVLHLLYARFWHLFLKDIGVVSEPEPFKKLLHQGIILGEDNNKMSKSRGNVVCPEGVIEDYGADALRLYEMFMGPLMDMKPWNMGGIEGVYRFLRRVWRQFIDKEGKRAEKVQDNAVEDPQINNLLQETISKVTNDIERLSFNTAISQMMIFVNHLQKTEKVALKTAQIFVKLLAPFAPHIAEELWARLGEKPSVAHAPWPKAAAKKVESQTIKIAIQVNGKVRGEIHIPPHASQEEAFAEAKKQERVAAYLEGKTIRKVILVPKKILNIVV